VRLRVQPGLWCALRLRPCRSYGAARLQRAWTSSALVCACGAAHAGGVNLSARLLLSSLALATGAACGGRQ